jgi:hypothetical protein
VVEIQPNSKTVTGVREVREELIDRNKVKMESSLETIAGLFLDAATFDSKRVSGK